MQLYHTSYRYDSFYSDFPQSRWQVPGNHVNFGESKFRLLCKIPTAQHHGVDRSASIITMLRSFDHQNTMQESWIALLGMLPSGHTAYGPQSWEDTAISRNYDFLTRMLASIWKLGSICSWIVDSYIGHQHEAGHTSFKSHRQRSISQTFERRSARILLDGTLFYIVYFLSYFHESILAVYQP